MSKPCTPIFFKGEELTPYAKHTNPSIRTTHPFPHIHSQGYSVRLLLQESSFQFKGKNYLQTHGTAMGTKVAVSFANIFMFAVETEIINKSKIKPFEWKRYIHQ